MQDKPKNNGVAEEGNEVDPDQNLDAATSLRKAREAQGITVDEIAHELHLSRDVVLALEAGDYETLGAPVFVRGHLRNYARLVDLPEDEIVADFHPYEPEPEEFRTLSAHAVVKPGASLPNFVLWSMLVFVLLVGAGYLLLGDDEDPGSLSGIDDQSADFSEPSLIEEDEPVVVEQAQNAASETADPDSGGASNTNTSGIGRSSIDTDFVAAEEPVEEEETVSEVAETIEPPVVDEVPAAVLTLRFSEECWVEISDSKRRLLYGLEKPGSEVDLQGTPPFKLFIGNIGAVDIEVAGRPYTIPQSGRRGGNTARFSIAKDSF